ncbi:MAG: tRNA (adenosine(37)-N6)-threonylcarbamoyltransferase complex transferase subunit TsaD [Clostridia bacterium]|nr:tRNA (adenosine(37)-N6)-threonylcarbamoyltransferase complex transferase subunit TsaD [Clostridia bacterium]MBQ3154468.1 tRNA (adenosine(37)-N6)-threonylcarbamoyltransferase complex transferase subunit TsaD [Clostridia bacterium]
MLILGIESSCDETAAAVVEDGRILRSNIVATQTDIHALYGGVVPEIASRAHTEAIHGVVEEALAQANVTLSDIDAIAVTYAPGLIGALLTGVSFAKGLAYSANKPLVPVHHLRGHVAAVYLVEPDLKPPFIALCVSGGNTELMVAEDYTKFRFVGTTRDDAAGEAFDKCARVLGLPYPGGAAMDKLASIGNPDAFRFHEGAVDGAPYDFSFSGLKTAVINTVHTELQRGRELDDAFRADIAASFTKAVVRTVVGRLEMLLQSGEANYDVVLSGGVAANSHLRKACAETAQKYGKKLYLPPLKLCGDNAAMIAAQGYYEYLAGARADLSLNAFATKRV